jgi:hypothetical protein
MLRSRKRNSGVEDVDYEETKGHKGGRPTNSESQKGSLVPTWLQVTIVVLFLFLGFASEHFKKSRGVDPFHAHSLKVMSHIDATKSTHGSSMLTREEDDDLEYDNGQRYHVIFSTDCSPYQHWQR